MLCKPKRVAVLSSIFCPLVDLYAVQAVPCVHVRNIRLRVRDSNRSRHVLTLHFLGRLAATTCPKARGCTSTSGASSTTPGTGRSRRCSARSVSFPVLQRPKTATPTPLRPSDSVRASTADLIAHEVGTRSGRMAASRIVDGARHCASIGMLGRPVRAADALHVAYCCYDARRQALTWLGVLGHVLLFACARKIETQ